LEKENRTRRIFSPLLIIILLISFLAIWASVFKPENSYLEVSFLDVGQGDSTLIEFPDGKSALVDGGPDKKVLEALGRNLPFYRKKIDIIFLSHPDADHAAGIIHVLNRYEVGRIVLTNSFHDTPEYKKLLSLIKEKNIPTTEGMRGAEFDFSRGNKIKVLYPENLSSKNNNDNSEVLLLSSPKSKVLFTGDIEKGAASGLLNLEPELKVDVLKVPHHGSRTGMVEELYMRTFPKYSIISCGEGNRYGHPHAEVTKFLEKNNLRYLRTDKEGDIVFADHGAGIEREKNASLLPF